MDPLTEYDIAGRSELAAAGVVDLALHVVLRGVERACRAARQCRPSQGGRKVH